MMTYPVLGPRGRLTTILVAILVVASATTAVGQPVPETQRSPTKADRVGYVANQSLWVDQQDHVYRLAGVTAAGADWVALHLDGKDPCASVEAVVFCGGTRRENPSWTGGLFVVRRATDGQSKTIAARPDGAPDIASLADFLRPSGGIGFITRQFDQSGHGHDQTAMELATAPMIDMTTVRGSDVPALYNSGERAYYLSLLSRGSRAAPHFDWHGGPTLTAPAHAAYFQWLLPGDFVSGENIPAAASTGSSIQGNRFSVGTLISGAYAVGQTLTGNGIAEGTVLTGGSGSSWTTNISQTVAPTTITGRTTIAAVDAATGEVKLSSTPAAAPDRIVFGVRPVWLDFPNAMQVPWRSYSVVLAARMPAQGAFTSGPYILGLHGGDGFDAGSSWSMAQQNNIGGTPIGVRVVNGAHVGAGKLLGGPQTTDPDVYALSVGGADGRDITFRWNGLEGSGQYSAPLPATSLQGGAIGSNDQSGMAPQSQRGDFAVYDTVIAATTLTLPEIATIRATIDVAHGWKPQIVRPLVASGSSTTFGNGTTSIFSWPTYLAEDLAHVVPLAPYNMAAGGPIEQSVTLFPKFEASAPKAGRHLLIFFEGLGNSLQSGGTIKVLSQARAPNGGTIFTVDSTVNTNFSSVGMTLSGPNLPAGATITAATRTTITTDPAHAASGPVNALTVVNDTARSAWTALTTYCSLASAYGYRTVLVGSATRGTYSGNATSGQAGEAGSFKVWLQNDWKACPGAIGYVDLEDYREFGDDGGMQVTAVDPAAHQVTVAALSADARVGNRIRWAGQPFDIAADTGGQAITAVAGKTLTLSGATTGLAAGASIHAVNPQPWEVAPDVWSPDHQHFLPNGYRLIARLISDALLAQHLVGGSASQQ